MTIITSTVNQISPIQLSANTLSLITEGVSKTDAPPVVLTFSCPATSTSLTIPITTFTASDDVAVTGYLITETATTPALDAPGWAAVAQTEYVAGIGDHILRGWAKDSVGNISAAATANCTVSVPELVVWLKSDTGQYQESTKTTPATSTNDPVGAWADQSGNVYDVTQTTNDNRGTLAINVLNGHSVVTFDGISGFLRRAAGNVGPWTAIVGDGWEVPGGFTNTGLVYDPAGDGSFWIGDFTNSKIINTTLAGAYIGEIVISAPPQGVALDTSDDTLWWADHSTDTIVHIQKDGTVLGDPISLAYDPNGCSYEAASDCLWVAQDTTRNIFRYSCVDGSLQQTIALSATEYGTVDGIHYESSDDSLWITTDNHDRLIKCRASDGLALGAWKIAGANSPECVTIVDGTLYFCNDAEYHEGTPDGNRVRTITIADLPPLDITIAIVVNADTTSGVDTIFAIGRPDDAVGVAIYFADTTTLRFVARDGANQISQDRAIGNGYRTVIVSVDAGNQATVRDNGAQSGAIIDLSSVPGCVISRREIGLAGNGNGPLVREANINVAEVAIFSRVLTLAEQQAIERSWALKFGI